MVAIFFFIHRVCSTPTLDWPRTLWPELRILWEDERRGESWRQDLWLLMEGRMDEQLAKGRTA